ncbi:hypothetical protein [Pandoravirus japonicus]|uniref:Uncharacterized protein n=1 Tax=Pandoravirus japonicus TaxID=2823154 RepID=A0A811BNK8_9VIRU|nr:hypothetical protein [Pandoravirus japonicus]
MQLAVDDMPLRLTRKSCCSGLDRMALGSWRQYLSSRLFCIFFVFRTLQNQMPCGLPLAEDNACAYELVTPD